MKKTPIVIVGAGPVGMCAALSLAKAGIQVIILEAKQQWTPIGSRAIVIDQGSLTHFREVGCYDQMLQRGLIALRRRTFFGNTELYTNEFPQVNLGNGEIPLFLNLPQNETEEILLEKIATTPLIQILWGHTVIGIKENKSCGVVITVENNSQKFDIETLYLLAADGCRSTTRHLCGLDFPGYTNPAQFLIVDVKAKLLFEREHRFFFSHHTNKGRTLLIVPQPNNVWRIDWQLPIMSKERLAEEQTYRRLQERVSQVIGKDNYLSIEWQSCYQFHQRLMEKMSHGNIFFLGDAAHLVNPFGARGMNSGIQDAANLTWKVAAVLNGEASPEFLTTYCLERWQANFENQLITKRSMNFIAPTTVAGYVKRALILRGSKRFSNIRKHVDSGKMSFSLNQEKVIPEKFLM